VNHQPHSHARAVALAALVLAALAAAAPAAAQTRKDPATKATPHAAATTPAATTTRSAAPAAIPLPPPPADAPARRGAGWLSVAAGLWGGLDAGQGGAVVADYGYLRTPGFWNGMDLELHLSASVGRASKDTQLTATIPQPFGPALALPSGVEEQSAWIVEVVPTARLRLRLGPTVALLADGGVGVCQTVESYTRDELFAGRTETTQNQTSLVVHLGAGMTFDLSERARIVFVPLALSLQLGTGFSAFVPTLGLAYRL
jgi:opacity protein-like surface antigen